MHPVLARVAVHARLATDRDVRLDHSVVSAGRNRKRAAEQRQAAQHHSEDSPAPMSTASNHQSPLRPDGRSIAASRGRVDTCTTEKRSYGPALSNPLIS